MTAPGYCAGANEMSNPPKLNNREIGRLADITEGKFPSWTVCRGTNESLLSKGLVDKVFIKTVCGNKIYRAEPTELGKQVLAGFPS